MNSPCADDTECAEGTACDGARCRQMCLQPQECGDDPAVSCREWVDSNNQTIAKLCGRDCDPVAPSNPRDPILETCLSGEGCSVYDEISTHCKAKAGTGVEGAPCQGADDCAPGLTCMSNSNKCAPLCWLDGGCQGGKSCTEVYTKGTPVVVSRVFALGYCL